MPDDPIITNQRYQNAIDEGNFIHQAGEAQLEAIRQKAAHEARPSTRHQPELSIVDGWLYNNPRPKVWRATFNGVSGMGDSPEAAYADFDREWNEKLT